MPDQTLPPVLPHVPLPLQQQGLDAPVRMLQTDKGLGVHQLPPAPPPPRDLPSPTGRRYTPRRKVANRQCPVCRGDVHARKDGSWACDYCGSKGGTFAGQGMYVAERGQASSGATPQVQPGRAQRRRQERHKRRRGK